MMGDGSGSTWARAGIILVFAEDTSPSLPNEVLEAVIRDCPVDEGRIL